VYARALTVCVCAVREPSDALWLAYEDLEFMEKVCARVLCACVVTIALTDRRGSDCCRVSRTGVLVRAGATYAALMFASAHAVLQG
jgi:hypothetical protein